MKVATLFFCLLFPIAAQSAGILRGVVTDQSGAVVPGATIRLIPESGEPRETQSGPNGSYVFTGLPPANYSVQAAATGLGQASPAIVRIASGEATLNLVLHVLVESQQVTVTDTVAPEVTTDPTRSASAQVLREDALESLSDDADDLITDLQMLAGPSAGPSGGQIFIDGFTAGDGTLPNKDSIREVRINQNPFSPEFDTLGTGHIEILTKPGAEQFHGAFAFTGGNDALNSRNPFATEKAPFVLKDYNGSASGKINSRGSFSMSFDDRHIRSGQVIHAITLDPAMFAIVSPFTDVQVSPMHRLYLGPRIDYQINSKNTLTVRYEPNLNTSNNTGVGTFTLASQAYRTRLMEHPVSVIETALLGSNTVNETRFQFRHQNSTQEPDSTAPSIIVSSAFAGGGASAGLRDYIHHHYEVQNYTTHTAGAHTIKFGARVRAVSIKDTSEQGFNGTYTFGGAYAPVLDENNQPVVPGIVCNINSPAAGCATISSIEQYRRTLLFQQLKMTPQQIRLLGGGASGFSINTGNPILYTGGADAGLFFGDDWKMRPNLTVSLGARYEVQENISDHCDFAPRIALAWAPGSSKQTPATVIRAGFGIFYDRFSEQSVLIAQRFDGANQRQYSVINPDTFPAIPALASLALGTQAIHTIASNLRAPYLLQSSVGIERQLPRKTTVAVTYINSHGLHELRTRNINAPLPGTYTGVAGSGVFPFPGRGPIYEMESAGLYNQNQLITTVNTRVNEKILLTGTYTLGYTRSNTDGLNTFPANQYSLAGEYGPAFNDIRNRVTIGGSITTKWKLQWSPLIVLQSGMPFNIITSQDIYGTTILSARPGIAPAPGPGVVSTSYGLLDPHPQPGEEILPRNFGRGPGQQVVNLKIARTIRFGARSGAKEGRYALTFSLSARNALNHLNPGPINGNINSPLFGHPNQLASGSGAYADNANNRRLELQARFAF